MAKFVLVPGAWLGGWVWNKIDPLLQEKGHKVYDVTLTGMGDRVHLASESIGIETAIQDVLNVIKYNDIDDFVLVGHSFAGKVAAAVADRVSDKAKMILYLDAFLPARNKRTPQGAFDPQEYGPFEPGQWTIPLTEKIVDMIGKDLNGKVREWFLSKSTPWPMRLANEPITLSKNFDSMKEAYIFCSGSGDPIDEIIAGKWRKLEGPYKVIDSGHWPMITKPEELARDMIELAAEK